MINRLPHIPAFSHPLAQGLFIALALVAPGAIAPLPSYGQTPGTVLLERSGSLAPVQNEYPVQLRAGQPVTIRMISEEVDTVLTLLGLDREEVAFNDDSEGTLNSRIVYTPRLSGTYTIVARSFRGEGGTYQLIITPATAYEGMIGEAERLIQAGEIQGAIIALSMAIQAEPNQPDAYRMRGDMYLRQAHEAAMAAGQEIESVLSLPEAARLAARADLLRAAELYEASGDESVMGLANVLRLEAEYFITGEFPEPTE